VNFPLNIHQPNLLRLYSDNHNLLDGIVTTIISYLQALQGKKEKSAVFTWCQMVVFNFAASPISISIMLQSNIALYKAILNLK